ncbi:hypothetical protein D8780_02205 [Notoacmeibacter ruber]|uniref:Uncharacterized protein n=1 Tax=Notoacmeibacter ruber TaxID=2670375 RepID=A0A3L7J8Z2_9HYPH|nr:hypothetical protein [Notoacmeibacter ruber]RLQ87197.1 hypothetical protein D8780_02205 [Notoacmeibacter ruber]
MQGPVSEKERKDRLAEQLRANIRRRKAQSHAMRGGKADRRTGLPALDEETREQAGDGLPAGPERDS